MFLPFPRARAVIEDSSHCSSSDSTLRKACRTGSLGRAAQVEPPGQRQADGVECEIDQERELRAAGDRDRLAEAARDQIAAARADRADEAERRAAFDARGLQRRRTGSLNR